MDLTEYNAFKKDFPQEKHFTIWWFSFHVNWYKFARVSEVVTSDYSIDVTQDFSKQFWPLLSCG